MNSITLTTLAATLLSFVAARYVLAWLVPLIPLERARRQLAEPSASSLVAAMLSVVAGLATMNAASTDARSPTAAIARQTTDLLQANVSAPTPETDAVARLAAFVRKTERNAPAPMTPIPAGHPAEGRPAEGLADVETMIARLAARLETDGSDADGWRTLGWSHFATDNYAAAAKAYGRALELRPDDSELKEAAAEATARAAGTAAAPAASEQGAGVAQK